MLYQLSRLVYPSASGLNSSKFAFLAASLHIISPAGLFLSSPFAESSFSFIQFTGLYLYATAFRDRSKGRTGASDILMLASGVCFGVATTFRSNGLLDGLIFCYDAINSAIAILRNHDFGANLRRLCVALLSGGLMALILIIPQYLAYQEFCGEKGAFGDSRRWCSMWVPSIYAWVQEHYW